MLNLIVHPILPTNCPAILKQSFLIKLFQQILHTICAPEWSIQLFGTIGIGIGPLNFLI